MTGSPPESEDAGNSSQRSAFVFIKSIFLNAIKLEWKTDAGRVNFFGMLFAFFIVVLATMTGGVQWAVETTLKAFSLGNGPTGMNPIDTVWIFLGFTLICVAMLGVLVLSARKHDPPAGR